MSTFSSRHVNSDPEPYVGWSGRRYSDENYTHATLDDGPVAFDPSPEFDNNSNPILVELRGVMDSAEHGLRLIQQGRVGFRDGSTPERREHAIKVLERMVSVHG